jgi:hypothetical protein
VAQRERVQHGARDRRTRSQPPVLRSRRCGMAQKIKKKGLGLVQVNSFEGRRF